MKTHKILLGIYPQILQMKIMQPVIFFLVWRRTAVLGTGQLGRQHLTGWQLVFVCGGILR
jgi:hypothetical protein